MKLICDENNFKHNFLLGEIDLKSDKEGRIFIIEDSVLHVVMVYTFSRLSRLELESFVSRGFFVRDRAFGENAVAAALEISRGSYLHRARVGKSKRYDETFRSDKICFSDDKTLMEMFSCVKEELQESLRTIFDRDMELQVAQYDEGSFFEEHLDCVDEEGGRRLTCTWYISGCAEGGELVLKQEDVIAPIPDRLVVFNSKDVLHRVNPVKRGGPRIAITAWYH